VPVQHKIALIYEHVYAITQAQYPLWVAT